MQQNAAAFTSLRRRIKMVGIDPRAISAKAIDHA